jgi:hypothetical protein
MNEEHSDAGPQRPGDIQEPGSGDPAADAYLRLAATCDRISVTNEPHIEVLGRAFTLASVAIVIEVALWGLQLALP